MDCSRRRVLECIACASERCNAIDTLCRNHVHNKLTEGPKPAHSLDADVAHTTKNRSDLSDKAPYVGEGYRRSRSTVQSSTYGWSEQILSVLPLEIQTEQLRCTI